MLLSKGQLNSTGEDNLIPRLQGCRRKIKSYNFTPDKLAITDHLQWSPDVGVHEQSSYLVSHF
jgi:hypothetical protein